VGTRNVPSVEQVAEFAYRSDEVSQDVPGSVVLRRDLSVEQSEQRPFDEIRYFFLYHQRPDPLGSEIVHAGRTNDANQENLIRAAQERRPAMQMPVDNW